MFAGAVDRLFIPRIRMTHDARRRVVPEDAFEAAGGVVGAVGDEHPVMLRIAHADTAAMVERDPGRARSAAGDDFESIMVRRPLSLRWATLRNISARPAQVEAMQ